MSASSTARVILSSIRKIYIPIIVLLVFCIPFLGFTEYAYADTVKKYDIVDSGVIFNQSNAITSVEVMEGVEASEVESFVLGEATIDGIDYAPIIFNNTYTFYGYQTSLNFNFKPMYAVFDNETSFVDVEEFRGYHIYLYLPIIDSWSTTQIGGKDKPNYSPTRFEWVSIEIGGNYGAIEELFITNDSYLGVDYQAWSSDNYTYWHFMVNTRYSTDSTHYQGSYSNYTGEQFLNYVFMAYDWIGFVDSPVVYTDWTKSIDFFPTVLTGAEKKLLASIDNLGLKLDIVNSNINDLLNYGSGSFDDLEQDIGNASDKAEQGNQEIEDNAPKPDIDNTHDDTTDIIDSVLTEHGENVSNILGAILGSNIVNGMLLISISVGAIKYIFFGKG